MDNLEKGALLEAIYRRKLMEKLVGDKSTKEQLSDRIMFGTNNQSPLNEMLNKPVYEELHQIPIEDQLRMMKEQFKALPTEKQETEDQEMLRDVFPLYRGQRLS